ncbi:MAG: ribose-phosphate pyrophosphokinase [Gammaproteobacteria bacterium]|nr:ribose-phosphate pyrophosphokinase [Pseudomonadota bacterium]MCH9662512.1 ribose-phosphate pyrophosphokinase [Gammaproteobacteria bacterium]
MKNQNREFRDRSDSKRGARTENFKLFVGRSNSDLGNKIARHLEVEPGKALISNFSDEEIHVEIEEDVRGQDVFVIQSLCRPANCHLMELLILVDALRRASAARITAVVPYFGYARQDRRTRSARVPITAKLVANMLTVSGVDHLLTVDIHSDQIQGFYDIPVDNVYSMPLFVADIWRQEKFSQQSIVVSPDIGGVARARAMAQQLNMDIAIVDKRREKANVSEVLNVVGDVSGKHCIIVDDIVDTAGTLCKGAKALKDMDAASVNAYIVHPVLSGAAVETLAESAIDKLVVTDTIPLSESARACDKIVTVGSSHLLAEIIRRINLRESVSSIYY